jgi:coenzyme F420-0:L-glutamate ligase / coenzyme F420-1:gamma-L-glutamate ligase
MSDFISEIRTRRSIRKYQPTIVPTEILHNIIKAASYSPSAHNAQPWRFIAITGHEQKEALADAMAQVWLEDLERDHIPKNTRWATVNASMERFTSAPALIVCCISMEDMDSYPDVERQKNERDLAVQSLSVAIQNLLLAAHAEGLGACWFCAPIFCKAAVREALDIPDEVEPQALITLGYPAENPKMPERHPVEAYAYLDKWGNPL